VSSSEREEENVDDDEEEEEERRRGGGGGGHAKKRKKNHTNDPNLFRILIATDNHLGAHERDPIRKNDAFIAFREILEIAKKEKVDALFLGGDLFDQNKPSRETLVQAMDVLREYVFGDDPITFEVVSDQSINFPSRGIVNFEDENVNVALPIFAIHGNHDDPSGQENLSALDILSSCSLINYFGKHALSGSNTGAIELKPVLLRKGETKLALYGLGWIRDQRLHQMMASKGNVKWIRPGSSDEKTPLANWFNLMLIHQNRVSHAPKNSISERHLPSWMDLVVWGHEHECLIEPQLFDGVSVSQPGSSVTTSLVEAESGTKKICILELKPGKEKKDPPQWRLLPVPLQTTRPYAFKNISLAEQEELVNEEEDGGGQDQEAIENFLMITVNGMIKEAMQNAASGVKKLAQLNQLPLIRLRVDLTGGFQSINVQKFGQKFVGKVANPSDMLLFYKSKKKRGGNNKDEEDEFNEGMMKENINGEDDEEDLDDARAGPRQDQKRIERLIKERMDKDLQILDIPNLTNALDDMVNREDNKAVKSLCESTMKNVQRELASTAQPSELIEASEVAKRVHELTKKHAQQQQQQKDGVAGGGGAKSKKGEQAATQRAKQVQEFQDAVPAKKSEVERQLDEEEALERELLAKQKEAAQDGRAQRPVPPSRRGVAKQAPPPIPQTTKKGDDDDYVISDSEDEDDDDVIPASAQPASAARRGRAGGAKSAAAAAAAAKRKQQQPDSEFSDDDEEVPNSEDDEDFTGAKPAPKKRGGAAAAAAAATRATRSGRGATPSTQTKSRKVPESIVIDDSSDSDEKATPSVAAGAKRASAGVSRGRGRARGAKVLNKPTAKSTVGSKRGRGAASKRGNNSDDSDSEERARPTRRTRGSASALPTGGTQRSTQRSGAPGGTQRTIGAAWGRAKK